CLEFRRLLFRSIRFDECVGVMITFMSHALETIVQGRIERMKQLHKTGGDIGREEKQAPALVLSNVNMLMQTNAPKDSVINANYHVAKGDRDKSSGSGKKRNDPIGSTAGDFNHTVGETHCRPCAQR